MNVLWFEDVKTYLAPAFASTATTQDQYQNCTTISIHFTSSNKPEISNSSKIVSIFNYDNNLGKN